MTRRVEPSEAGFGFVGSIYVLADNNTLSAGDSFVSTMREVLGARVLGVNTTGWGQQYQAKMYYSLPNSGIIIAMDSELTFNADGSMNNYVGVIPDATPTGYSYPTPFPQSFLPNDLLNDPWIAFVLQEVGAQP